MPPAAKPLRPPAARRASRREVQMHINVAASPNPVNGNGSAGRKAAPGAPAVVLSITHEQKTVAFRIQNGRVVLEPLQPSTQSLGRLPRQKSKR